MLTQDKVALVTGGISGLGRATAEALVAAGAKVVAVDVAEPAEELPEGIVFQRADVREDADMAAAFEAAAALGEVRVAVSCAGIGLAARVLSKGRPCSLDDFKRVIDVNLVGSFNLIRHAAARMASLEEEDGERGVIVTTASIAAFDGQIGQAAYSASKGGVVGLMLPVARDLAASQIRICTIAPGVFETPILRGLSDEVKAALEANVPHPSRLGRPAEFASLAMEIIGNPMLNGETIRLDGALRMAPR
jgi:NAD(P)-dependent dehydrogenase (short-subunit alcohol dehydrogenase family)